MEVNSPIRGEGYQNRRRMNFAGIIRFKVKGILIPLLLGSTIATGVCYFQESINFSALFIISALVLVASSWLMHCAVGIFHFHRMTIPSFWYLTYLAMIFIPSFFVFFNQDGPGRYTYLFAVESLLITVPIGMLFVNMMLRFKTDEIKRYFETAIQEQHFISHIFMVCLMGLAGALALMLMYMLEVKTLPLLYMIRNPGDFESLIQLREDSFKLLDSPLTYVYYLLRVLGFPFLIMLTLGYYMVTKKRKWLALFAASLGSGVLYAAFEIAKAPVAAIILMIFVFLYLYRSGRISIKAIAVGLVLLLLFPLAVVMTVYYGNEVDLGVALNGIGERIFYRPAQVLYWYFELFPGDVGYLYGRSIGKLSWLMGWDYFDTPNYVGLQGLHSTIESVSANGAFIGDLNANFGMVGVLLGGIMVGMLMQGLQGYLVRQRKTILNLAVYAYCMFAFWLLHSTSLPVVLASNGVILVFVLPWVIRATTSILRDATNEATWQRFVS